MEPLHVQTPDEHMEARDVPTPDEEMKLKVDKIDDRVLPVHPVFASLHVYLQA